MLHVAVPNPSSDITLNKLKKNTGTLKSYRNNQQDATV